MTIPFEKKPSRSGKSKPKEKLNGNNEAKTLMISIIESERQKRGPNEDMGRLMVLLRPFQESGKKQKPSAGTNLGFLMGKKNPKRKIFVPTSVSIGRENLETWFGQVPFIIKLILRKKSFLFVMAPLGFGNS